MSGLPPGAIRLENVSRRYRLLLERNQTLKETILRRRRSVHRDVWALRDVSFEVAPGEALGVVGSNGAGKSTLLKLLAGILPANSGAIDVGGQVVSMLELGAGFHPDFTGRENVFLNASIHGMSKAIVEERMDSIIEFSELGAFIDAPVRTYSSGMYTRLGFAVAAELEPDVLLLDEVFAVGDAAFQSKCLSRIADFRRRGVTIVFVSHSQWAIQTVCDRAIWLSGGSIVTDGNPVDVLESYHQGLAGEDRPVKGGVGVVGDHSWRDAHITSVSVVGPDGPCDRLVSGDHCTIEVSYESDHEVAPVVALTVRTVEGALIAGTDNRAEAQAAGARSGMRSVRFRMDHLPLMEGRFSIDAALEAEAGGQVYHEVERAVEFTVFPNGHGFGPVSLGGAWLGSVPEPSSTRLEP